MAGTTPENFVVNRGGWNCNHSLYPLPDAAVPKEVREKLEKAQANKMVVNSNVSVNNVEISP